jgi:hypothetical protein
MINIKNLDELIETKTLLSKGSNYVNKLTRALLYRGDNDYDLPTYKENEDMAYRMDTIKDWATLNSHIRGVELNDIKKITPLAHLSLVPFYLNDTYVSQVFSYMKDYLRSSKKQREDETIPFDPSKYPVKSQEWCISRLFDMTRSNLTNVGHQISIALKDEPDSSLKMSPEQISSTQIIPNFKDHFSALEPLLEGLNDRDTNIIEQVKMCQKEKVYTGIISKQKRISDLQAGISSSPSDAININKMFNNYLESQFKYISEIQEMSNTMIGRSVRNICKEKKL